MIDLHAHILPGVDDGARDEDASVAMAWQLVGDGVSTVVATPHAGRATGYDAGDVGARCDRLRRRLDADGAPLRLVPGAELYVGPSTIDELRHRRRGHRPLGDSRTVLVEFSPGPQDVPALQAIGAMMGDGWRVLLAHPERYPLFQRQPSRLRELLAAGGLAQVTDSSLLGLFGARAQRLAEALVRNGLAAVVASDAHDPDLRRPRLHDARRRLVEFVGEAGADLLTRGNPAAVLADAMVEVPGDPGTLQD